LTCIELKIIEFPQVVEYTTEGSFGEGVADEANVLCGVV
jgi:hypothetical protein